MSATADFDVIVIGAGHNGHPEQMIGGRLLVAGSAHATPIPDLYLCGASCHPGPGVTFLPGYGAAHEVAAALIAATPATARAAA